ncbi:tetratricopeptide repeat protein [Hyphomicrobium sp. CS1BSMeth3]|uniref:tetratricopeptide repeat protein n=1 Tax=Hyphomicrobium sp. CS1BSMeth3 TaxID=1892844 RepID=UPI000930B6B8|nr:tetratricopeptide repeat protein [Hyphomicrobium sp. CS1BSMeth3]
MPGKAVPRDIVFSWEGPAQHEARLAEDPAFLAEHMRQAAISGDVEAQLGWAHMLLEGHGTAPDPVAAFRWFQLAARSRSVEAINMLGRCHELGWGTARNTRLAAQCYRVAGEAGHAWANFNLAMLMLARDGAEGEKRDILSLLVRSARRGNAKAMNAIGEACEEGWRGAVKIAPARRWYIRAARRGCFRGAFNTARHLMGDGNVDGAVHWLRQSIARAPGAFCAELASHLADHPDSRLREVAALAHERALSAPERAKASIPGIETKIAPDAQSTPRRRRSAGRVWRALTRAKRSRPV